MIAAKLDTYSAVRLGPDKNPAKGTVISGAPATERGIADSIMALWKAA